MVTTAKQPAADKGERQRIAAELRKAVDAAVPQDPLAYIQGFRDGADFVAGWALSVNGVSQPLDFEPNPKGNLVIVAKTTVRDGHAVVEDHVRKHDPLFDRAAAVFMPHHATCPQAHKWKRT